jgi:alpha-galactosidase
VAVIGIVGAGSVTFTRTLVSDLLQQEATRDCELRLFDTDERALCAAKALVDEMRLQAKAEGLVRAAADLRSCVEQADYVICTILVGGRAAAVRDFEVTEHYGLRHTVGDTLGAAGISRALRTIPAVVQIAQACADTAPNGLLLNHTNPMGMVVSAVGRAVGYPTVGLCHSADFTVRTLAAYLGLPSSQIGWWSAGVNHLAWVLSLTMGRKDLYPALARAAEREEVYELDRARFDLMKRVGYFVTESSKHVAEYLGWYIGKPSEVQRLNVPVGEFLTRQPVPIAEQLAQPGGGAKSWLEPVSNEYAPALIAALESNGDWGFQANVMNDDLIDNLSANMCVEVPCMVSRGKVAPARVGALPLGVAALSQQALLVQELTVEAVLRYDRDLVYQALLMDPQTSALLDVATISQLAHELVGAYEHGPSFTSQRLSLFDGIQG